MIFMSDHASTEHECHQTKTGAGSKLTCASQIAIVSLLLRLGGLRLRRICVCLCS